ncbi:ankyrin, partial [Choiromyces venosus 120613-1]
AAWNGHDGVVKTLLTREDVNPNTPDTKYGKTPLCRAAQNGHDGVVKTLLAREDVDPNTPDTTDGLTPLCWAAQNGHDGVVKTLLAREDVNPNTPDTTYGKTPLCWAAKSGQDGVVKTLLAREDVRTDTPDNLNEMPLSSALSGGHNQIVKMLQERISHSSDPAHDGGQEIPSQSAGHWQEFLTCMLCDGSDLSPDITDLDGPNVNLSTNPKKRKRISADGYPDSDITNPDGPNAHSSSNPKKRKRISDYDE